MCKIILTFVPQKIIAVKQKDMMQTYYRYCTHNKVGTYCDMVKKSPHHKVYESMDLHVEVPVVPFNQLSQMQQGEPSEVIRARVIAARKRQEERFKAFKGVYCNAQMSERMIHQFCEPDEASLNMLRMAMERLHLSARAYNRILKVARTIADIEGTERVQSHHIAEAIGYRNLDRGDWSER